MHAFSKIFTREFRITGRLRPHPLWLLCLFPILQPFAFQSQPFQNNIPEDCIWALESLMEEDTWFEQLYDPIITSQKDLEDRVDLYRQAHGCILEYADLEDETSQYVLQLLEYYLIFLDDYQDTGTDSTLLFIDPAEDTRLAVLRDQAGIQPPPGYFYVRIYPSRLKMPSRLKEIFSNSEIAGINIQTRYVAVIALNNLHWKNLGTLDDESEQTLTHELIHAYINSAVGLQVMQDLPTWYQEGLAIYFSGGAQSYTYYSPSGSLTRISSEEYQGYHANFQHLQSKFGRERLLLAIRHSIESKDPSCVYRDLGFESEAAFFKSVSQEQKQQLKFENWLAGICIGIPTLIGVVILILSRIPEEDT